MPIAPAEITGTSSPHRAPYVRRTRLMTAASPAGPGGPISLKLEFPQHTGSFNPRGATPILQHWRRRDERPSIVTRAQRARAIESASRP
jgi:threonine dehydratase